MSEMIGSSDDALVEGSVVLCSELIAFECCPFCSFDICESGEISDWLKGGIDERLTGFRSLSRLPSLRWSGNRRHRFQPG